MALKALDQRLAGGASNPSRPSGSTSSNVNTPSSTATTNGDVGPKVADAAGGGVRSKDEVV